MKIIHFNVKNENNDELLNVVVPTKAIEGNILFKNLVNSINENAKDLDTDVIVSAVESSGPEFSFAKSVNHGLESQDADYYLNVNDDVIISKGSLEKAIENMKSFKDLGLHGAVLRYPTGRIQHAGVGVTKLGFDKENLYCFINYALLTPAPLEMIKSIFEYMRRKSPFIYIYKNIKIAKKYNKGITNGAFHLFDKDTYKKTGGYDENYKMGKEDDDFCLKVIKSGKKIRLDENVKGIHLEGAAGIKYVRLFGKKTWEYFYNKWDCETIMKLVDANGPLFLNK